MNSRNQFISFRNELSSAVLQGNFSKDSLPKTAREMESSITVSNIEENDFDFRSKETGNTSSFNKRQDLVSCYSYRNKFLQTKESVSASFHNQDKKNKVKLTYADLKKNKLK